jgi:hypothetical protein
VQQLDKAVADDKKAELKAWVTLLSSDQVGLDPKVVTWSQKHGIRNVPIGVFEDVDGPPSYGLARDAELTVLLFVKRKVVANFAFRTGEMKDRSIEDVMKALPLILAPK